MYALTLTNVTRLPLRVAAIVTVVQRMASSSVVLLNHCV